MGVWREYSPAADDASILSAAAVTVGASVDVDCDGTVDKKEACCCCELLADCASELAAPSDVWIVEIDSMRLIIRLLRDVRWLVPVVAVSSASGHFADMDTGEFVDDTDELCAVLSCAAVICRCIRLEAAGGKWPLVCRFAARDRHEADTGSMAVMLDCRCSRAAAVEAVAVTDLVFAATAAALDKN